MVICVKKYCLHVRETTPTGLSLLSKFCEAKARPLCQNVKKRICPYGILSKKQKPTGLSFFHRDTPQGVTRYMQGKNMFLWHSV